MDKNEINNNDIKTNFDFLFEKYELLEKENAKNKETIKMNEYNIINLKTQLQLLRTEYMQEIRVLEEKYKQQFQHLLDLIMKKGENNTEKNNIIMNDKNDDIININDIYDNLEKMVNKKLGIFQDNIFYLLGKSPKKEKNEIIEIKEDNLIDIYEKKLSKIFFDKSSKIDKNDKNEFKKISKALIIKGKSPYKIVSQFLENNINNYANELSEDKFNNIALKKQEIYDELETKLIKEIDTKDEDQFIKEFREKYGITKKDFSDKDLKNEIKHSNCNEHKIIKVIFKRLNYLNKDD